MIVDLIDHGAKGDGVTLNTAAFRRAIDACDCAGGGTVRVSAGRYVTGTFELRSNLTLHLEAGAVILGSPNLADYRVLPYASELRNTTLILADGAENVAITGPGTIDGNADAFAVYGEADTYRDFEPVATRQGEAYLAINDSPEDGPVKHKPRPGILILFVRCRNVRVRDVRLMQAPNWCLHVACSEDVLLSGLEIKSSLFMPNSGGLDVSLTRNVRISDCNIEAGDDAIAFSPCADGFGTGRAENITVTNCVLLARSAALRIGWSEHNFRNLVFTNIVIRESNRGIVINLRRGERIENVLFSNLTIETRLYRGKWWGKGEPIHISALAEFAHDSRERVLRNVTFSNVTIEGEHGVVLQADERSRVEGVTFENVRLTMKAGTLQETFGGNFDFRPAPDPQHQVFAHDIPAIYVRGIRELSLHNVEVAWRGALPAFFGHALECEDFEDLRIDGFRGAHAHGGPAIALRRGRGARVGRFPRQSSAPGEVLSASEVTELVTDQDLPR